MEYLNTHPEELDISRALAKVSAQRGALALRYLREEDRKLSLAAYLLLQLALEKEYGITEPQDFAFGPGGKPYLKAYPGIHFNLSHCPAAALCVVDSIPVGCDIETVENKIDTNLYRRVCSPQELQAILKAPHPPLAFTTLWTRKEAFLKLRGEGISDALPGLLVCPEAASARFESHVAPDSSYVYTVCRQ